MVRQSKSRAREKAGPANDQFARELTKTAVLALNLCIERAIARLRKSSLRATQETPHRQATV